MESEKFIPVSSMTQAEQNQAAELLGCSPILVDALMMLADSIRKSVTADLIDIWERLEEAGV